MPKKYYDTSYKIEIYEDISDPLEIKYQARIKDDIDGVHQTNCLVSKWEDSHAKAILSLFQEIVEGENSERAAADEKAKIAARFELAGLPVPEVYR